MYFRDIYWLGGSPCSGKSTVAARLAEKYGFGLFHCDDYLDVHMRQAGPGTPTMQRLARLHGDALWMRPVAEQVEDEIAFYREEFPLLLRELRSLPGKTRVPVVAEGAALMPDLLASLHLPVRRIAYLIPEPDFQVRQYAQREWKDVSLKGCRDPQKAFENWMERDRRFGDRVHALADRYGFWVRRVGGSRPIDDLVNEIERHFELKE